MKKFMSALLVAAFCASAMAEVLIYDYAASFKRINVADKVVKLTYKVGDEKHTAKLDSVKVASDRFTGYVVIAACKDCTGEDPVMTASASANNAVVYVRRGSKKTAPVYRTIGKFYADMFGAKAGVKTLTEDDPTTPEDETTYGIIGKYTDAAGFLTYAIGADAPAFMGKDHVTFGRPFGDKRYDIEHAGFGKVQENSWKVITQYDCDDDVVTKYSCYMVKNLSGSMLGAFFYTGVCSDILADICAKVPAFYAPICGTFTLKLNSNLSKKYGDSFVDADEIILDKMIGNAAVLLIANATDEQIEALDKPSNSTTTP